MQDVEKTIVDAFQTYWTLETSDFVKKENINFRRGEPVNLTTRFSQRPISIEVGKLTNPRLKRTLARSHNREIVSAHIWILIRPKTDEAIAQLKDYRQEIIDEIRRIIHDYQLSLKDIKLGKILVERHLDQIEVEPPVLHTDIEVECRYASN